MSVRTDSPHPHPSDASSMQSLHVALSADVMQVHCAWLCQDSAKFKKLAEKVLTDMGRDLIAKTSFLYMPITKLPRNSELWKGRFCLHVGSVPDC